jgi:glycosyltransferase involved in cell wall biosynthesis
MSATTVHTPAPRVSVIMPAYNSQAYIADAIRSVQAQTLGDWELLVIDDGSRDDTCSIVTEMALEDPRIRLYRNEENMGAARSRNRGIAMSRGAYVALLDSDDLWRENKLQVQLDLAQEKQADIVYCSYAMMDERGCKRCDDFLVPRKTDLKSMLVRSVISCSTVLLSRQVALDHPFPTGYYHEDYALWLQLLQQGHQAFGTDQVLADYRVLAHSRASNKLHSACHRWTIYRSLLHLSRIQSIRYLGLYAFAGFRKYRIHRA